MGFRVSKPQIARPSSLSFSQLQPKMYCVFYFLVLFCSPLIVEAQSDEELSLQIDQQLQLASDYAYFLTSTSLIKKKGADFPKAYESEHPSPAGTTKYRGWYCYYLTEMIMQESRLIDTTKAHLQLAKTLIHRRKKRRDADFKNDKKMHAEKETEDFKELDDLSEKLDSHKTLLNAAKGFLNDGTGDKPDKYHKWFQEAFPSGGSDLQDTFNALVQQHRGYFFSFPAPNRNLDGVYEFIEQASQRAVDIIKEEHKKVQQNNHAAPLSESAQRLVDSRKPRQVGQPKFKQLQSQQKYLRA